VSQSTLRNILRWYESGESEIEAQKYQSALTLLEAAYSELETTYSELEERVLSFPNWEKLLNMLIVSQCELKKFDDARNRLVSLMQRIEHTPVTETLMGVICKTADVFIAKCFRVGRLDDAARVAIEVVVIKKNNNILALEAQRMLAEIHLRQNNMEDAEKQCREILQACDSSERAQIHEEIDILLVLINYRKGNRDEAIRRRELISEKYKSKKYPR
jgi:tetratricopeptide (TPR) repeat protein